MTTPIDEDLVGVFIQAMNASGGDRFSAMKQFAERPIEACAALDRIVRNTHLLRREILARHAAYEAEKAGK